MQFVFNHLGHVAYAAVHNFLFNVYFKNSMLSFRIFFSTCALLLTISQACIAQKEVAPVVLVKGTTNVAPTLVGYKNNFGDIINVKFKDDYKKEGNTIKIWVKNPILLEFITTNSPHLVYAKPGDTITVSRYSDKSYNFTAKGAAQHRVDFFGIFQNQEYDMGIPEIFRHSYTDTTYSADILFARNLYEKRLAILHEYAVKYTLEEDFQHFAQNLIKLYYVNSLFSPYWSPVSISRYNLFPDSSVSVIYHSPLRELRTQPALIDFSRYKGMIVNYVTFLNRNQNAAPDESSSFYRLAVDSLREKERNYALFYLMKKLFKQSEGDFNMLYDNFHRDCSNLSYRSYIDSISDMRSGIMASPSVIATQLEDINGRKTTWGELLGKNKGNVVYVDFWASWCGPCLAQMPFSKKMEAGLGNRPIVFLYLSVDDDKRKWRKAIQAQGLNSAHAQHYILSGKSALADYLRVPPIPRYLLIDRANNTVSLDAMRPQNPSTMKQIEGLTK